MLGWNIFDEIIESNSYIPIFSSPNHAMLQMRANMTGVPSAMKGDPSFEGLNTYPANYEKRISEMLVPGALGDADAVGYQNWWHSGNSKVVGLVYLGRRTAGIPTVVHGGLIHSLINESVARLVSICNVGLHGLGLTSWFRVHFIRSMEELSQASKLITRNPLELCSLFALIRLFLASKA